MSLLILCYDVTQIHKVPFATKLLNGHNTVYDFGINCTPSYPPEESWSMSWWGAGFFPACEDFGRMFDQSFPSHALNFFFKVETRSRTLIPLFMPGSVLKGSASWDDCGRVSPDELRVSSFPAMFPGQRLSKPTLTSLGQWCIRI